MDEEKVIKLINLIDEHFDYEDIDEIRYGISVSKFNSFSEELDNIFNDSLNDNMLDMISKIDKKEIFYLENGEKYKSNKIRKKIVSYLDSKVLCFDFEIIKKNIGNNRKLVRYLKDKSKIIELVSDNEEVILYLDSKCLTEDFVFNQMKNSDFISKVFLGLYGKNNNLYRYSSFYRNSGRIKSLLFEQVKSILDEDLYVFIKASDLIKDHIEIVRYILKINPKFCYYIGDNLRQLDEFKDFFNS